MLSIQDAEQILSIIADENDFAEIYMERKEGTHLIFDGGELDDASGGIDSGVALRIVKNDVTYFANGNDTDSGSIMALARELARDAEGTGKSTSNMKPDRGMIALESLTFPEISSVMRDPLKIPIDEKVDILKRADVSARGYSKEIVQVTAQYIDSVKEFIVANTEGTCSEDRVTIVTLAVHSLGKRGDIIRSGWKVGSRSCGFEIFEETSPEHIGSESARIAILQLDAKPAPAGTFTVVLSSKAGGTMIHEACGHGLEADFIDKGVSVYSGQLGKKVASDLITVIDDGTMPGMRGSSRFDEEGNPSQKVILIEKGILRRFLHSGKTSKKMNVQPTGNGRRESYRHLPIPRMRNTYIAPGTMDPAAVISQVEKGVFVADMGGGEVDTISGNFVFHCSEAYMIRDGKVCEPIRDATLTGNGPEILKMIDAVGSDLGFQNGTCGKEGQSVPVSNAQPTIRIPRIVVGGSDH